MAEALDVEEAIRISQCLIDTIPDYWDENFDYDGDVQVVYDSAIDLLEELLKDGLSDEQHEWIFSWYEQIAPSFSSCIVREFVPSN